MDYISSWTNLLLFCMISLVLGAVIMLIVQYYIFMKIFKNNDDELESNKKDDKKSNNYTKFTMPENILNDNIPGSYDSEKSQLKSINLVLQFLFSELHQTHHVRKWFLRKISMELEELLTKTAIGKFFSKLTISKLDLGSQFPTIKAIDLLDSQLQLHPIENHIENLDILLNVQYKGDFLIKIDANMVLGKKGSLSIKVKQLSGLARLQFTRIPFTHWSLSFEEEPNIDLQIESEIQGRTMQSATNLIGTAIKKAIRRKHTLPFYKLRFKPFFKKLIYDEIELPMERFGKLEVNLINLTRLNFASNLKQVYATLTLSSHAFVFAHQMDDENVRATMDIEIHKAKNQQIGIVFKQSDRVVVESILPNTPAKKSHLKSDDVLLSVEGKSVVNLNQVAKILKSITRTVIRLRVERVLKCCKIKNDAISDDVDDKESHLTSSSNISFTFSKKSDTVSIKSDKDLSDSPAKERIVQPTPKSSPEKTAKKYIVNLPQHSTVDCALTNFIRMNDTTTFELNNDMKYLNISIHGRSTTDNALLGYINVPVDNILAECVENNIEYREKFILNPPEVAELTNTNLSQMSGFCSEICYGDILLNFKWDQSGVTRDRKEQKNMNSSQEDDGDESKKHNFVRTHFTRSTQCEFCGKKIWLKDAVQCRDCQMTCHKKCMMRSQSSTICYGAMDQSDLLTFKVTDADGQDDEEIGDEVLESYRAEHRKSFSDMLASGIKRVNSANNLNIPTIVSSLSSNSKSLPPTPQHSSRKPSLVSIQSTVNPFVTIVERLEDVPGDKTSMTQEEIERIIAPIDQSIKHLDDLMELAKSSSEHLYAEFEMEERIKKINDLLSKLRVALDSATMQEPNDPKKKVTDDRIEEKLQLLSVIMLHLCSGLQSAQSCV